MLSTSAANPPSKVVIHYNDVYRVELPNTHSFPMEKYRLVRENIQRDFTGRSDVEFAVSPMATSEELSTTHCPMYVNRFLTGALTPKENRKIGFPWSISGVQRSTSSVGGTVAATRAVLSRDEVLAACHVAGGTHHAFYDYGEGYCVFSDIAVAANIALKEFPEKVKQIVIIDLDVHQGNGNAVLFQNNPRVFTFSMHCAQNYFSPKQLSNKDVEVEAGTADEQYLSTLQSWLPFLTKTLAPDLIFFQAGVDIHEKDRLGKLKISREGVSRRNRMVFGAARRCGARIVTTMGGGYPRNLDPHSEAFQELIETHSDVYRDCVRYFAGLTEY
jgi:acetoin utilization deacetylase AcuC-like enzyme